MYRTDENSTQHGEKTPHGLKTPHKKPQRTGTFQDILSLTNQLYPTGRAFRMPSKSQFEEFHKAINMSLIELIEDAYGTVNSTFPDNENFTAQDANLWEYRYGLQTNENLDLEVRKMAIRRKMAYRGLQRARQHQSYIQNQLNLNGFNVGVYENSYPYLTPEDLVSEFFSPTQHGGGTQHGLGTQHGGASFEVIANNIEDENFSVGGVLWPTFFIAGMNSIYEIGTIPANRKKEFRELILKLKPAHTVAYLIINYT